LVEAKGMHWNTFERLREQERMANHQGTLAWLREADALLGRSRTNKTR
jgi:hypothetical protein